MIAPASGATFTYTTWPNVKAVNRGEAESGPWAELIATLRADESDSKIACPMIKLATFSHGCKAEDMLEVHGIEGDYDAGLVSLDEAAQRLQAAGVEAILYTSGRHTADAPRWRVLAPLSRAHTPAERAGAVALLNGALGGILAPESFTPAQRYFYGPVKGAQYETRATSGACIDTLDLFITPIGKPSAAGKVVDHAPPASDDDLGRLVTLAAVTADTMADLASALAGMADARADDRGSWIEVLQALASLKSTEFDADAYQLAHDFSERSAKFDPDDFALKWDGMAPTRITYKSIFKWAAADGWVNPRAGVPVSQVATTEAVPDQRASLKLNLIPLSSDADAFDDLPHCVAQWIPQDEVTLLAGHGGGGKSYVALSLAVHVALGLPFGPLATTQTNVLFFSGEDGARVLRQRLARVCRALDIDVARLDGKLFLLDASDRDPALHREQRVTINGRPTIITETPLLATLAELVQELGIGLAILDNASDAFDGDEIKRVAVRAFIRSLRSRLARPGRAVLLLAHANKASATNGRNAGAEDYSGSTAWHNSVRSRLSLTPAGANACTVEHLKANLGPKARPVRLEWCDGVPLVVNDVVATAEQAATQAEHDQADKLALLAVVRAFDARGERVTTSTAGNAPVFKQLRTAIDFPQRVTTGDRLTQLLRALQDEGHLFRRMSKSAHRKDVESFTCSVPGIAESAPHGASPAALQVAG